MNFYKSCTLDNLLELFSENLSCADILSAECLSSISAAITKKRLAMHMSQKEFASFLNVSQGLVSRWESSNYNFSIKLLCDIAARLDMKLNVCIIEPSVSNAYNNNQFSGSTDVSHSGFSSVQCNRQDFNNVFTTFYIPNYEYHTPSVKGGNLKL